MTREESSTAVPRWGTPKQWYLLGLVGLAVSVGTAALAGLELPEAARFLLRPVGSLGIMMFFGGFGIGVTKSRQRDRSAGADEHD